MVGGAAGEPGVDDEFVRRGLESMRATIMGRNMFGPVRGPWPDDELRGWWGDDPPYHHDVFVLTHHPREPVTMAGGTTFHFVPDGIQQVLSGRSALPGVRTCGSSKTWTARSTATSAPSS